MDNKLNGEIPKGIGELPKPFQMYLQIIHQISHHVDSLS